LNWTPTRRAFAFLAGCTVLGTPGCGSDSAGTSPDPEPPQITGDVVAGLETFKLECSSCHTATDGFDLKFFAFPDTTIVRRAVAHVDTAAAHDIVAYIRTVRSRVTSRDLRLFQPGGQRVGGDQGFAAEVFGGDRFPPDMTAEKMAAIDPLAIRIALDFPLWSFESSNLDWMPEFPIDPALLTYPTQAGVPQDLLDRYYESYSVETLISAVLALRLAERDPANPDAPCVLDPFDRFRANDCFETRRWIATLAAQHMLRTGDRESIHRILHDGWWDVGNAARRSLQTGRPIANSVENWAQWMYLGWAFEPDRHASIYLGLAMNRLGLPRHSTFHAARALVVRPQNSRAAFEDVENIARFAPEHWLFDALRFGMQHLVDRLDVGVRLQDQYDVDRAKEAVAQAYDWAVSVLVDQGEHDTLALLRDQILTGLDQVVTLN